MFVYHKHIPGADSAAGMWINPTEPELAAAYGWLQPSPNKFMARLVAWLFFALTIAMQTLFIYIMSNALTAVIFAGYVCVWLLGFKLYINRQRNHTPQVFAQAILDCQAARGDSPACFALDAALRARGIPGLRDTDENYPNIVTAIMPAYLRQCGYVWQDHPGSNSCLAPIANGAAAWIAGLITYCKAAP